MPVEIEAKFKLDDADAARKRLRELHAERIGEVLETNTFFDTPDKTLFAQDRGLRLRHNHDAATHRDEFIITFKGPRQPGPFKTREEIELAVSSPDEVIPLFRALGYDAVVSFEKRRESWRLSECKIEIDELPHLGTFIEIEGPDENAIVHVRDALRLGNLAPIKTSYIALLLEVFAGKGESPTSVTFPPA